MLQSQTRMGRRHFFDCAHGGCIEVGKLLLQHDADITVADNDGWSALHIAAFEGNTEFVSWLLEKSTNFGRTSKPEWREIALMLIQETIPGKHHFI